VRVMQAHAISQFSFDLCIYNYTFLITSVVTYILQWHGIFNLKRPFEAPFSCDTVLPSKGCCGLAVGNCYLLKPYI